MSKIRVYLYQNYVCYKYISTPMAVTSALKTLVAFVCIAKISKLLNKIKITLFKKKSLTFLWFRFNFVSMLITIILLYLLLYYSFKINVYSSKSILDHLKEKFCYIVLDQNL